LLCTSSCVTLHIASDTQRQLYYQTSRQERQRIPRLSQQATWSFRVLLYFNNTRAANTTDTSRDVSTCSKGHPATGRGDPRDSG
jgi:hypothetical protein